MTPSKLFAMLLVTYLKEVKLEVNYSIYRCLSNCPKSFDAIPSVKVPSLPYYTNATRRIRHVEDRKLDSRAAQIALQRIDFIDLVKSKLYGVQTFYDEISGMNEVKVAQNKVIEFQDQLLLVQERRRHILVDLALVRTQLQDIHIELQKTTRGERRYMELINQEFAVLAREKEKDQIFQIIDQEVRELFSHLTAAVTTSHEKARTQANNVKYWSIIASGGGALLGIVVTSINYYFRNTQYEAIRKTAEESNCKLVAVEQKLANLETSIERMNVDWSRRMTATPLAEPHKAIQGPVESWGSYFRRHVGRLVKTVVPKP